MKRLLILALLFGVSTFAMADNAKSTEHHISKKECKAAKKAIKQKRKHQKAKKDAAYKKQKHKAHETFNEMRRNKHKHYFLAKTEPMIRDYIAADQRVKRDSNGDRI